LHHARDLAGRQDLPVDAVGAERAHLRLAVAEVDGRRLLQRQLGHRGGDVGVLVLVIDGGREQNEDERERRGDDREGLAPGPVPPPVALAAYAPLAVPAVARPAVARRTGSTRDALGAGEAGGAALAQGRCAGRAARSARSAVADRVLAVITAAAGRGPRAAARPEPRPQLRVRPRSSPRPAKPRCPEPGCPAGAVPRTVAAARIGRVPGAVPEAEPGPELAADLRAAERAPAAGRAGAAIAALPPPPPASPPPT